MPAITNSLVNSVPIADLPDALEAIIGQNPRLINDYVSDGFSKIRQDFVVDETDDKTPLINMQVMDILQPAKDDFNPTEDAIKFGARLPEFHDIDIDLSLKRSSVLNIYRSYIRFVTGLKSQKDVLDNPWPLFFLKEVMMKAGHDLAVFSAFRGVRTNNQVGALKVLNGLLYKFTAGRGGGGDIPTGNVFDSTTDAAGFDADAYDEINSIAQLTEADDKLAGRPLIMYVSAATYRKYRGVRRAASPNIVSLNDFPETLDDFPNIRFKVEEGLGNKRFSFITVPNNLYFILNENYTNFNLKMIEDVKGWSMNVMFSADVNYGVGRWIFSNDRTD